MTNPDDYFGYVQVRSTLAQDRPEIWVPFLAAGPLAGFVFAAFEAFLWRWDPFYLGPLIGIQALLGLMLSFGSILGRERVPKRDGPKIRDVRRPDSQVFATNALLRLATSLERGDVLGCDPEDLRRFMLLRDPYLRTTATRVVCYRALLRGEGAAAAAQAHLKACDEALDTPTNDVRQSWITDVRRDAIYELAFAQALEGQDAQAEITLALLDHVEPGDFYKALLEATLARARDKEEAARRLAQARDILDRGREVSDNTVWKVLEQFLALVEKPTA